MQSPSPSPSSRRVPSLPPSDIHTDSLVSTQQIDGILQEKLQTNERNRIRINSMALDAEGQLPVEHDTELLGRAVKTVRRASAIEDDGHVDCDCGTMVV